MKKVLVSLVLSLASFSAQADFLGVKIGLKAWEGVIKGTVAGSPDYKAYTALAADPNSPDFPFDPPLKNPNDKKPPVIPTFSDRGVQFEYLSSAWIQFEHPIPMLPNLRLAYTEVDYFGDSARWAPTEFLLQPFRVPVRTNPNDPNTEVLVYTYDTVLTKFDMDVTDATFYYELLDNFISFDLGFTLREMKGEFKESNDFSGEVFEKTTPIDLIMPLLYGKAEIEVPFLDGLSVAATANLIGDGDNSMVDFEGELIYMMDLTVFEIGFTLGYRYASLVAEDFQDIYSDANISGVSGGLIIHF